MMVLLVMQTLTCGPFTPPVHPHTSDRGPPMTMTHNKLLREGGRERERERLDLNLTQEESDIANGLLQYRRGVSL